MKSGGGWSGVAWLVAPPGHWHRRSTVGEMSATVPTGSLTCPPPEFLDRYQGAE